MFKSKILAIVFCLVAVLAGLFLGIFIQRQLSVRVEQQLTNQINNLQNQIDILRLGGEINSDWNQYIDEKFGFAIQIPPGYYVAPPDGHLGPGTWTVLSYPSPQDPTPLPVMILNINKGLSNFDIGKDTLISQEESIIGGVTGKKIVVVLARGPATARCPYDFFYKNPNGYVFSLWDCLEWDSFDEVVKSFRFLH